MNPEQWRDIKAILQAVLDLTPVDRSAYLEGYSESVRREVESLLRAHECDRDFLGLQGSDAPEASLHLAPEFIGRRFGPYRVLSQLGEGGMGTVWLAERVDGLFTRQVALKLIHPALMGRVMAERVAREREILASLNHPNIAKLFDAGFGEDGQPYLALEYVSGTPLITFCDEHHLTVHERLVLFRQVLGAVQYAHAHLVIHRDLKPSNILVSEDGQVHLLDFGIAKLLTQGEAKETHLTQIGGRALTPDYAAPEQIAGAPITTAADIYALGVMLYELLTGERPYRLKRESRGALEEAILQTDPVAPSHLSLGEAEAQARSTSTKKLARTLKGDLDTITSKALKKLPRERYATANAFGEDVARFLSGEVVLARPDSFSYRARKFVWRYRAAIAVVGALFLTLAGGLVATSYEADIASSQRDAALDAQRHSLTQTAAGRLREGDVSGAMDIILEVLPHRGAKADYTPEALSVFQEARAEDLQTLALTGHMGPVRSAAFSPDGRRLVTASRDKTASLWDVATGGRLMVLSGHTDSVYSAAFSPDGREVITASKDKTARIWDAATGRQILLLSGHADGVYSAAFSPGGLQIVTASFDKTARIWDAVTGRQMLLLSGHTDTVESAAFSPDGRQIVTASFDGTARIWDAASGRQVRLLSGHTNWVVAAAFSPDGKQVVTASVDKTARIWDAATGRQILPLSGHTYGLSCAAFSPDGKQVVTASYDKTARIWDAATGRQVSLLTGHTLALTSAGFSPDGRQVVTTSFDRTARIWGAAAGRQLLLLTGHTDAVESAAFSPDGQRVVTASFDKSARVWDATTGRQVLPLDGHTKWVVFASFSPDGRRIVTASSDKTARLWDAATGRQVLVLRGHADTVLSAAFSPDGQRIVTASIDKTARVWDAATGRQTLLLSGHTDTVSSAAFSPDGHRIVTGSYDNSARIWDAATGRQLLPLSGHSNWVNSAGFSPGGDRIVTASYDRSARIWDAATGRQLISLSGHSNTVAFAAFSPDGRQVVTASLDNTTRIWDAVTGRQMVLLSGHTDGVESAMFSPDGTHIVTASFDKTARIWNARVPALNVQIPWTEAARFDLLSSAERLELGLQRSSDVRPWPADQNPCDRAAAAPYDPGRRAAGSMPDQIDADIGLAACTTQNVGSTGTPRIVYQRGRVLVANGNFTEAALAFERAGADGYPAAQVDLGILLTQPSAGMLDVPRAISLFERAWADNTTIAAFELGDLYEHGLHQAGNITEFALAPDETRAWSWYQKGAEAGEPNALARFAKREDSAALVAESSAQRNTHLLEAFRYYAAAAERARLEDWPDDAWESWRYRRASLARVLEREGMMQEVADAYAAVQKRYAPSPPTLRQRLVSYVRIH